MNTLSACLIVKNEETNLERCLKSIDPIVDEIIVVDTGSTDKTIDIAKSFSKTKLYQYTWNDHFAEARNISLQCALSDWIIVVDGDEYVSPNDYETIIRSLDNQMVDGYYIVTYNYTNNYTKTDFVQASDPTISNGYLGWTPSHKTRIFRNKNHYRFRGRIHEVVDQSILDVGGILQELDIAIHHYGNDIFNTNKIELYKRLAEKKVEEDPRNPMGYYELGQIHIACGNIDAGINTYKKGIEINPNFGDYRYANFDYEIGNAYYQFKSDKKAALEHYLKAIERKPGYMYVYSMVGSIYRKEEKYSLAEAYLQESIALESAIPNTYYELGLIRIKQGQYNDGIQFFKKVIAMAPKYSGAYNNLAIAYHLSGNVDEARKYWKKGFEVDPQNPEILEHLKRFGEEEWPAAEEESLNQT